MNPTLLSHEIHAILMATFFMTLPFLLAAVVLGLLLGLIQAVIQIQDQTVSQMAKIIVVALMIVVLGSWISSPMVDQARRMFVMFPTWVR